MNFNRCIFKALALLCCAGWWCSKCLYPAFIHLVFVISANVSLEEWVPLPGNIWKPRSWSMKEILFNWRERLSHHWYFSFWDRCFSVADIVKLSLLVVPFCSQKVMETHKAFNKCQLPGSFGESNLYFLCHVLISSVTSDSVRPHGP